MPLEEDVAELKATADERVDTANRGEGGPVDVVPTSREEVEQQARSGVRVQGLGLRP